MELQVRLLQACASYPYSEPYYTGVIPAYGPQGLVRNLY